MYYHTNFCDDLFLLANSLLYQGVTMTVVFSNILIDNKNIPAPFFLLLICFSTIYIGVLKGYKA